MATRVGRVKFS